MIISIALLTSYHIPSIPPFPNSMSSSSLTVQIHLVVPVSAWMWNNRDMENRPVATSPKKSDVLSLCRYRLPIAPLQEMGPRKHLPHLCGNFDWLDLVWVSVAASSSCQRMVFHGSRALGPSFYSWWWWHLSIRLLHITSGFIHCSCVRFLSFALALSLMSLTLPGL